METKIVPLFEERLDRGFTHRKIKKQQLKLCEMKNILISISIMFLMGCSGNHNSSKNINAVDEIIETDDSHDSNNYSASESNNAYANDYGDGYDIDAMGGEDDWQDALINDPHNWESEDVDGIYVYLEGVDNDDEAEYYASEYYDGEYIREGWKYFAKVSQMWGEYEVTLGERVSSNLFKVRGSDIYIHFKWLPDVSPGDEGILDWSGMFSTFYIKP